AIVGPERARGGDGDEDAIGVAGVDQYSVEAEAARARRPFRAGAALAQPLELVPALAAVGGLEHRGIFDAGIHGVGIAQRGLEMPDALELPRMRRPVVPLMRAGYAVVHEFVVDRLERFAAVVRALNQLAEPPGALRTVETIRIGRRSLA